MAFEIWVTDCKGFKESYSAPTVKKLVAHVERLMNHGRKYIGDKIVKLEVTSGKKVKP